MGNPLPDIDEDRFRDGITQCTPVPLDEACLDALWIHFVELRRWNPKLSLIGPGTADEIIERHYGESLAALPLIDASDRTLVDVGSGGGFPGFVLAAARRDLAVTLIEPRQRKWAFLKTVVRRGGLSCQVLDARVERPLNPSWGLPESIDVVTLRALVASPDLLGVFRDASPEARFLLWRGREPLGSALAAQKRGCQAQGHQAQGLESLVASGRTVVLRGEHRKIVELVP